MRVEEEERVGKVRRFGMKEGSRSSMESQRRFQFPFFLHGNVPKERGEVSPFPLALGRKKKRRKPRTHITLMRFMGQKRGKEKKVGQSVRRW